MKNTFNKTTSNFGCYGRKKADTFLPNENFDISDVLNSNVSIKDKAWFIRRNCEFTDTEYRKFAIGCAICVLPIYEARYPENKAPREAIQAAQDYLNKTISIEELRTKRAAYAAADAAAADAAAYAADAAAYAAYAADAAAYAADAADAADAAAYAADAAAAAADDAAAYAAAYAADAAAYAADAAAAAADVDYRQLLLSFFKEFTSAIEV